MDILETTAGSRTSIYQRAALVLRTLGWLSICWGAMISIYIWMGERAGSNLWLYWTIGQFAAGGILLGIAGRLQNRAADMPLNVETELERHDHAA